MSRLLILLSAVIIINGSAYPYRQWQSIDHVNRLKRTLVCQNIVQETSDDDVPLSTTSNRTSDGHGPGCTYEIKDNNDNDDELISGNWQHKQPKRSRKLQQYPEKQSFHKDHQTSSLIFILRPVLG